ncbi:MAG TPA: tetratricopeptide repeat protein [Gammaproteobacteria bacterium]
MQNPNKALWLLLLASVSLGSGCTQLASRPASEEPALPQEAVEQSPDEDAVTGPLPKIELTTPLLYRLLVAEFAEQAGVLRLSAEQYLYAAEETRDPRLAKHATRVAMYGNEAALATRAAALWQTLAPEDREADQALAAVLISENRLAEARPHLERIIQAPAKQGGAHGYLIAANLLGRASDKKQALALMDELVRPHSHEAEPLFAAASLAAQLEQPEQALARLDQVLRIDPHHLQALITKARLLHATNRKEEAITTLRSAVNEVPDNTQLRTVYARMLIDDRRLDEARNEFRIVDRKAPNDPDVIYALGLLALQANDLADGEKQFLRLLSLGQREAEANYALAQIAETRGDTDKAIAYYEAVSDGDNVLDARLRAAMLVAKRDGIDQGRNYLHNIRPDNAADAIRVWLMEGELLRQAERYDEAMVVYDDALALFPDNPELLYARAMMAERIDRLDILEADLRAILRQNPDDAQALNALGYTLADRTNRYAEAYQLVEKALRLSPDDAAILDSMGWVLYRQGRYDESIRYLKQAFAKQQDPELAAHLGEVLWVSGQQNEARRIWDAALKQWPEHKVLRQTIERFAQ